MDIYGRSLEVSLLDQIYQTYQAELVSLIGRRRVGKTYLIKNYFRKKGVYFSVTGLKKGNLKEQLEIFRKALQETFFREIPIKTLANWNEAFEILTQQISQVAKNKKVILFFDELPWLCTSKSNLIPMLDHYWNTDWVDRKNLKVILCGSAASWMIAKIVHNKEGLHNRLTHKINLAPFTLSQTKEYLDCKGIQLTHMQILELYMTLGGIPHYLDQVKKGFSAAQNIDAICFNKNGLLYGEFNDLFASLFDNAPLCLDLFHEISKHRNGISRNDLIKKTKLPSGGRLNKYLDEMIESGFIASFIPIGKKSHDVSYRVIDEYSYFYKKWIQNAPHGIFAEHSEGYWLKKVGSSSWKSWSGFTFEGICLKHIHKIKQALGLNNVPCEVGSWYYRPKSPSEKGVQIDLLIDRSDGVITLCEIKHSQEPYVVTKSYAEELEQKIKIFKQKFKTNKHVLVAMITTHGLVRNPYANRFVTNQVLLEDFF